jgi:hypothetical protein
MSKGRQRWDSNPHLQNLSMVQRGVPIRDFRPTPALQLLWSSLRDGCQIDRYRARARKLTLAHESTTRALAGTRSLRPLAANFGVSHETVRAVVSHSTG